VSLVFPQAGLHRNIIGGKPTLEAPVALFSILHLPPMNFLASLTLPPNLPRLWSSLKEYPFSGRHDTPTVKVLPLVTPTPSPPSMEQPLFQKVSFFCVWGFGGCPSPAGYQSARSDRSHHTSPIPPHPQGARSYCYAHMRAKTCIGP